MLNNLPKNAQLASVQSGTHTNAHIRSYYTSPFARNPRARRKYVFSTISTRIHFNASNRLFQRILEPKKSCYLVIKVSISSM